MNATFDFMGIRKDGIVVKNNSHTVLVKLSTRKGVITIKRHKIKHNVKIT